jgi:hypothetical protein
VTREQTAKRGVRVRVREEIRMRIAKGVEGEMEEDGAVVMVRE